jgi:hypothetical protein
LISLDYSNGQAIAGRALRDLSGMFFYVLKHQGSGQKAEIFSGRRHLTRTP